jgi:uncharacterized protein (TIGR00369 family)
MSRGETCVTASSLNPPHPDFRTLAIPSPFISLSVGQMFERADEEEFVLGLWTEERHANARGQTHGGLILSLADISLGLALQRQDPDVRATPTIHVDADFVSAAPIGRWLEFRTRVVRIGGSVGFSQGLVVADGRTVTRISGVFKLMRASRDS